MPEILQTLFSGHGVYEYSCLAELLIKLQTLAVEMIQCNEYNSQLTESLYYYNSTGTMIP